MRNTITVYACGGTGTNIGKLIEGDSQGDAADLTPFANLIVYYVDTSDSNLRKDLIGEKHYIFEDLDGSGSDRTRNKTDIADSVEEILLKLPPGDLSIVINSTGGGSGSVIGPLIASRLLQDEKLVICMATQVNDTVKRLTNTIKVLENYEAISKLRKKVLPLFLCDNSIDSESVVNATIRKAVQMLAILFSGKLDRLDSADLDNWINYNKVTSHEFGVALLDITRELSFSKDATICSVASIVNSSDVGMKTEKPLEYNAIGIIDNNNEEFKGKALYFALLDGPIQRAYELRKSELEESNKIIKSRKSRQSIANSTSDNDGMVF